MQNCDWNKSAGRVLTAWASILLKKRSSERCCLCKTLCMFLQTTHELKIKTWIQFQKFQHAHASRLFFCLPFGRPTPFFAIPARIWERAKLEDVETIKWIVKHSLEKKKRKKLSLDELKPRAEPERGRGCREICCTCLELWFTFVVIAVPFTPAPPKHCTLP